VTALPVTAGPAGVRLELRVMPRAPRTAIDGVRDGRLVVRVTAPPVDDAANDAVIEALSRALDVPRRAVRIVGGATARNKTIEIAGLTEAQLRARLMV
jgi:uncharacterized protein (TIGR00251 family)